MLLGLRAPKQRPNNALVSDHARRQARRVLELEHVVQKQKTEMAKLRNLLAARERSSEVPVPKPLEPTADKVPASRGTANLQDNSWRKYGGASGTKDSAAVGAKPERASKSAVLFVHFIPPPLRSKEKKDLPWMVHTCDGSGCREARHVSFESVSGFSTYEGAPPEQSAGSNAQCCTCQIANHHLRGRGKVHWSGSGGHDAVVESDEAADEHMLARIQQAHQQERLSHRDSWNAIREENKRLREHVDKLTLQRDAAVSNELLLQMALAEAQRDGATKAALVQPSRAVGSLRLIRTARATASAASEGRVPTDSKPCPAERGERREGREVAMELLLA